MSVESQQLQYAPRPSSRRKWLRRSIAVAILAIVGVSGYLLSDWLIYFYRVQWLEARAARLTRPADQVVYEELPTSLNPIANLVPNDGFGRLFKEIPIAQRELSRIVSHQGYLDNHATLFFGARCVPGGDQRIIRVDANRFADGPEGALRLSMGWCVVRPASVIADSELLRYDYSGQTVSISDDSNLNDLGWGQLRFYAGQADPNDPSRFTIAFETPAGTSTIAGQLLPDDSLRFNVVE